MDQIIQRKIDKPLTISDKVINRFVELKISCINPKVLRAFGAQVELDYDEVIILVGTRYWCIKPRVFLRVNSFLFIQLCSELVRTEHRGRWSTEAVRNVYILLDSLKHGFRLCCVV